MRSPYTMPAVGDSVRVNIGRRGGIQDGTCTRLHEDGSFSWKNACNYERRSTIGYLTAAPARSGELDPYVAEWTNEKEEP